MPGVAGHRHVMLHTRYEAIAGLTKCHGKSGAPTEGTLRDQALIGQFLKLIDIHFMYNKDYRHNTREPVSLLRNPQTRNSSLTTHYRRYLTHRDLVHLGDNWQYKFRVLSR